MDRAALVAIMAAWAASARVAGILPFVTTAFSLAAAAFFPALVAGIFWRRANRAGAVAGMFAGLSVCIGYIVANLPAVQRAWGLAAGTHTISVAAENNAGEVSNPVTGSVEVQPPGLPGPSGPNCYPVPEVPGTPTGAVAQAIGDGRATVTWTAPNFQGSPGDPIEYYRIQPYLGGVAQAEAVSQVLEGDHDAGRLVLEPVRHATGGQD